MKRNNLFVKLAIVLALVFLFTGAEYAQSAEKKKETATKKTETADKADKTKQPAAKVNINKATKGELTQLYGIGDAKAEDIITYRKNNGDFKKLEDLMNVKGIGEATFNKNKDRITLK